MLCIYVAESQIPERGSKKPLEGLTEMDLSQLLIATCTACVISRPKPGEATHIIALDCEYVGGGTDGRDDLLARVSIVNEEGKIVYDKYVKPRERVTDFRTSVSGIRPENIAKGLPFGVVQMEVAKILKDRVVVGHALNNDFRVLNFTHNSKLTRDTAKCHLLRKMANCNGVSFFYAS
ncbi:exonuclease [Cooperia oncophora]